MKTKKAKNRMKVLLSFVIAITMIGIPATIFTGTPLIQNAEADTGGASPPTIDKAELSAYTAECCIDTVYFNISATDTDGLANLSIEVYDAGGNLVDYYYKDP